VDTQRANPQQLSTKPPDANQRRSTRLLISVPIVISGKNARGEAFREETRTISISRQGASIATAQPMAAGAEIIIENPPLHLAVKARVIRFFEKSSQDDLNQIGVELLEAKNVWGIQYPPGDWQKAPVHPQAPSKTSLEATRPPSPAGSEKSSGSNISYTIDLPTKTTDLRSAPPPQPETSKPMGQVVLPNLEIEAERLLRATGMKLAKLAGQIDAKLQVNLHNGLSQLEEKGKALSALDLEINGVLDRAKESSSHLEELLSNLDAARQRTREEVEQARQSLQEITEQLVKTAAEDASKRVSQNLESATSEFAVETQRMAREQVLTLAQEFKQEIRDFFQALTADQLSSTVHQLQTRQAEMIEETQRQLGQIQRTGLENFKDELQQGAQQLREATLASITQSSQELDRQKATLDEQIQQGIQQVVASALEGFRAEISQSAESFRQGFVQELQQTAQQLRDTTLASITQSSQELDRQKATLDEQIQQGIQQVVASALEGFQAEISQSAESFRQRFVQELQQNAQQFRETTLSSIAQECAARASLELDRQKAETHEEIKEQVQRITRSALDGFQTQLQQSSESLRESATSTIVQQGTARAIAEIQSRQEELVEQAKNQFQLVLRSSLQGLQAEINQVEQGFRDFILPALTQECIAKSTAALQSEESAVVERIQRQADLILHSATESCQAESERVARTLRESTLPKLAEECAARTAQALQAAQRNVVNLAEGQMKNASQSTLESFRHELRTTQQQFKDEAQALLKLPTEQINQHAKDTLEITRGELASLRSGTIDEAHSQLAAITRGTLESITAEAKAIAEEYRAQLRDTFDSFKEKGVTMVEGYIREAVEQSRESLLRQLQSDAEDLTTIAVTQFRNKADEAIREATEAVNKQVGSAAFVVKDWLDQANQRLDANLARLETRSDTALEAIENRSRDVSRGILEKLQRESEVLIEDLRSRIGSAAEALAFKTYRSSDLPTEKSLETPSEQPRKTPARSSK
jgi:hypothetical protein